MGVAPVPERTTEPTAWGHAIVQSVAGVAVAAAVLLELPQLVLTHGGALSRDARVWVATLLFATAFVGLIAFAQALIARRAR